MVKIVGGKELEAVSSASVPNNSIFVDTTDGMLKFKDGSGNVQQATIGESYPYTFNRNYPATPSSSSVYNDAGPYNNNATTPTAVASFTTTSITGFSESKDYYWEVDLSNSGSDGALFDLYNSTKSKVIGGKSWCFTLGSGTGITSGFIRGGADISSGDTLQLRLWGTSTGTHSVSNFDMYETTDCYDNITATNNPAGKTFSKLYITAAYMVGGDSIDINGTTYSLANHLPDDTHAKQADAPMSDDPNQQHYGYTIGIPWSASLAVMSQSMALKLNYPIEVTSNITWNAGTPTIIYRGVI